MTATPTASVIVPVYNEARWIEETARAAASQHVEGGVEVLFVDGASSDGTRAMLDAIAREDPRIRVLDNPQRSIPIALNIGLEHARGEYVARMDAHAWFPPEYVQDGIERLRAGGVAWVAGPVVPRAAGRWSGWVGTALGSALGQGGSAKWADGADGVGTQEHDLDLGVFAGVWTRETLERLGGWDPDWPVNEDGELAARVLAEGGRIVCLPSMAASYAPRDSPRGLARQYARFGFYRVKTARRHPIALRRSHLASAGLAATGVAALLPRARLLRRLLGLYGLGVVAGAARAQRPATPADVAGVSASLAIMHLAWGAGFLAGCGRFGVPVRALRRLLPGS